MTKKQNGCLQLATTKVKKITNTLIAEVATNVGLSFTSMKNAWENQERFDTADLRETQNGTKKLTDKQKKLVNAKNKEYFKGLKVQVLTPKQACGIIREYIFTDIKAIELLRKYSLNKDQFYKLLADLEVSGKVLGKKIFDPSQYSKAPLKQVIRLSKGKKVTLDWPEQLTGLTRKLTVLDFYL